MVTLFGFWLKLLAVGGLMYICCDFVETGMYIKVSPLGASLNCF